MSPQNPDYMRDNFHITIETWHIDNDSGKQENVRVWDFCYSLTSNSFGYSLVNAVCIISLVGQVFPIETIASFSNYSEAF